VILKDKPQFTAIEVTMNLGMSPQARLQFGNPVP